MNSDQAATSICDLIDFLEHEIARMREHRFCDFKYLSRLEDLYCSLFAFANEKNMTIYLKQEILDGLNAKLHLQKPSVRKY